MILERTMDAELVRSIIGHPGIKPLVMEGDDVLVPMHESIFYLVAREEVFADGAVEDKTIGVVAFLPVNPITWNPHIAVLPEYRGSGSELMKIAAEWMFDNTPCRKVFAAPPVTNKAMVKCFEKCGFALEGRSPDSFLWHGEVVDRLLMGLEKERA